MALLQSQDEALHDTLDALHESGKLAWSLPSLNLDEPTEPDIDALDNATSDNPVPPSEVVEEYKRKVEQYRLGD
jgi:hypothetical protein